MYYEHIKKINSGMESNYSEHAQLLRTYILLKEKGTQNRRRDEKRREEKRREEKRREENIYAVFTSFSYKQLILLGFH
jgi:hypothetical protein